MTTFVDTSALLAFVDANDERHRDTVSAWEEALDERLVTHTYVIVELLALIHRRRYQDWSLPKGKLKNGESWQQAALREVLEETGCEALLGEFAGQIDYDVRGTPKRVMFWHMQAVDECQFYPNEEVDAIEWLPPDRALKRLNYAGERALLARWLTDSEKS